MIKILFFALIVVVLITIVGRFYVKQRKVKIAPERISTLSEFDPHLKEFKDTAQAHIDYLIKFMGEHDSDDSLFRYAVKSGFIEGEIEEHMWSQVREFKDGFFIGTLANDPVEVKNIKYNEPVKIKKEDVEDWILQDFLTNTEVGSYSRDYLHKTSN